MDEKYTLADFLKMAQDTNAATAKLILRDEEGYPMAAFIVINGTEECEELLKIIEDVEDSWEA